MSYADMAAKGPKQSDEEKMPHHVPEIAHSDSGVHSIDSLSSNHISSQSSYADQQLGEERAAEAREEASRTADKASKEASRTADKASKEAKDFTKQADSELQRLEGQAGKKYQEWSEDAKDSYGKWKKEAKTNYEKAKKEGKEGEQWAEKNKGNPVVIGNAVVIAALGGVLGVGAYRMHQANQLTWKVAGAWAGVVGLFAVGDYYVSQYFFKKYPTK